jgi:hypothetical protein
VATTRPHSSRKAASTARWAARRGHSLQNGRTSIAWYRAIGCAAASWDRLLPISAPDDVDAGDELLGLDERPVAEQRLPVADADRRGRVPAPQRVPQDLEAACLQVLPPGFALILHRLIVERRRWGSALTFRGITTAGSHPPIIEADVFEQAQQILADHAAAHNARRAELAATERELAKAGAAIDRYLAAFENGTLDPEDLAERLAQLKARSRQLAARRDELASQLALAPTAPPVPTLHQVADCIDEITASGSQNQRKALIEALIAQVKITGPGRVIPVFRIPQTAGQSTPTQRADAASTDDAVRAMTNLVELRGLEPLASCMPCYGSVQFHFWRDHQFLYNRS